MKELTQKSDIKGFAQALGHLLLLAGTGTLTVVLSTRGLWAASILLLWVHGIIYSFVPGLATHELSHGTVFRTKWLNGFFLRLYSLLGWVNLHHYKYSHMNHHRYTLFPEGDREVVLPQNPSLRALRILQLLTFDVREFVKVVGGHLVLALTGKFRLFFNSEWSEAIFAGYPKARRKAVNWSRMVVLFHAAVVAVGIALGLWMLPIVVTLGSFVASFWKYLIGMTMHVGLRDNVADWRKCARTIKLDPFSRFIYWNMNFHAEHHMYAAVPCYNLKALSKEIAWDMPEKRSLLAAWKEMRYVAKRQKTEPGYQWDTPVPNNSQGQEV
jgi:fatty acid desaturase